MATEVRPLSSIMNDLRARCQEKRVAKAEKAEMDRLRINLSAKSWEEQELAVQAARDAKQ